LVARPLAIYVSINPFGTAAAAIHDVILVFGINTIEKRSPVDAANSIRVFGGWTLQIQIGAFQV